MGKMKKVSCGSLQGFGPTVADARRDLNRKINETLSGCYVPALVCWRGWVGVLTRRPLVGWSYFIVGPTIADGVHSSLRHCNIGSWPDRKMALGSLVNHLAQNAWKPEDGCGVPEIFRDCSYDDQLKFSSWCQFQLAAAHAKDVLGLDDAGIHAFACANMGDF